MAVLAMLELDGEPELEDVELRRVAATGAPR